MTHYLVTRHFKDGAPTDRVILFHAPDPKRAATHIRRIHALSDWRHVGWVDSDHDDLDQYTGTHGKSDEALFRRTGVDVRQMLGGT